MSAIKEGKTVRLYLFRKDLFIKRYHTPIAELALSMFDECREDLYMAHQIVFIDLDGTSRLMKDVLHNSKADISTQRPESFTVLGLTLPSLTFRRGKT